MSPPSGCLWPDAPFFYCRSFSSLSAWTRAISPKAFQGHELAKDRNAKIAACKFPFTVGRPHVLAMRRVSTQPRPEAEFGGSRKRPFEMNVLNEIKASLLPWLSLSFVAPARFLTF